MAVELKQPKQSKEEQFRSSVRDALVLLRVLGTFCSTVTDAVGMAELSLENEGQLNMLISGVEQAHRNQ